MVALTREKGTGLNWQNPSQGYHQNKETKSLRKNGKTAGFRTWQVFRY
jgi:hypothetical protein